MANEPAFAHAIACAMAGVPARKLGNSQADRALFADAQKILNSQVMLDLKAAIRLLVADGFEFPPTVHPVIIEWLQYE